MLAQCLYLTQGELRSSSLGSTHLILMLKSKTESHAASYLIFRLRASIAREFYQLPGLFIELFATFSGSVPTIAMGVITSLCCTEAENSEKIPEKTDTNAAEEVTSLSQEPADEGVNESTEAILEAEKSVAMVLKIDEKNPEPSKGLVSTDPHYKKLKMGPPRPVTEYLDEAGELLEPHSAPLTPCKTLDFKDEQEQRQRASS